MANEMPLVSVVVPMYNTEKYIEQMLESVLVQTIENYELIIVDDCSTDKSCELIENYMPKFEGRLKLIHMKENTGCAGIPRNKGLEISRGKYVFFMDSDDAVTNTALEDLYNTAEKFEADVIICKRYMNSMGEGEDFYKNVVPFGELKDTTTGLIIGDISQTVDYWLKNFFLVYPWIKFIKRDFLIESDIKFLPVLQEDSIWTLELVCLAKRIILSPTICYIHRERDDSLTATAIRNTLTVKGMRRKLDRIVHGFNHVDKFMSKVEFFKNNPEKRYAVLDHMAMQNLSWIYRTHGEIQPHVIYGNLKEAFKDEFGENNILFSYLATNTVTLIKILKTLRKMYDEEREKNSDAEKAEIEKIDTIISDEQNQ